MITLVGSKPQPQIFHPIYFFSSQIGRKTRVKMWLCIFARVRCTTTVHHSYFCQYILQAHQALGQIYLYYTHYSAYIKVVPCTILLTEYIIQSYLAYYQSLFFLSLSLLILNSALILVCNFTLYHKCNAITIERISVCTVVFLFICN